MPGSDQDSQPYYDAAIAGRPVEADGGSLVDGVHEGLTVSAATREAFRGILTGRRMDIGEPPWRWLEIGDLSEKPENFAARTVWCEESFIYLLDEGSSRAATER
jgi:hypothetical protein